jgi:hypothetical protein
MDNNTTTEFSNIVTPPDFITPEPYVQSIALIDPEWSEIEDLAFYLKTAKKAYNVYVYRAEMNDQDWLQEVLDKAHAIIVNTVTNDQSPMKDRIAVKEATYYYGPKNFLMNKNKIEKPIDYFVLSAK